jgi:hypothetical protein
LVRLCIGEAFGAGEQAQSRRKIEDVNTAIRDRVTMEYAREGLLWLPISLWKTFIRKVGDVELLGICKGGFLWDENQNGKKTQGLSRLRKTCSPD